MDEVSALVLAVVDEFLKKHGFAHNLPVSDDTSPSKAPQARVHSSLKTPIHPSPLRARLTVTSPVRNANEPAGIHHSEIIRTPSPSKRRFQDSMSPLAMNKRSRSALGTNDSKVSSKIGRNNLRDNDAENHDGCQWLQDLLAVSLVRLDNVSSLLQRSRALPLAPGFGARLPRAETPESADPDADHDVARRHDAPVTLPSSSLPMTNVSFSTESLSNVKVLGQVDRKFIACIISSSSKQGTGTEPILVVVDQHAADERVSLESILGELCSGFIQGNGATTDLRKAPPIVIVDREEGEILRREGVCQVFRRWGIGLELPEPVGDYLQVTIQTVPAVLSARLRERKPTELTRLIKFYLQILDQSLGEVLALIADIDSGNEARVMDWGRALRWMPKEMLELANSKACRGKLTPGTRASS